MYEIGHPPDAGDPQSIISFLIDELKAVKQELDALNQGRKDILYAAPGKPRVGQVVYADGTRWNPGSGAGLYVYSGTAWLFLPTHERGNWAPVDTSGGAIGAYTVNAATYDKIGRTVFWSCYLVFPITANGAQASIGGLPYAPTAGLNTGAVYSSGAGGYVFTAQVTAAKNINVMTAGGGTLTNAQLSNQFVVASGHYDS